MTTYKIETTYSKDGEVTQEEKLGSVVEYVVYRQHARTSSNEEMQFGWVAKYNTKLDKNKGLLVETTDFDPPHKKVMSQITREVLRMRNSTIETLEAADPSSLSIAG